MIQLQTQDFLCTVNLPTNKIWFCVNRNAWAVAFPLLPRRHKFSLHSQNRINKPIGPYWEILNYFTIYADFLNVAVESKRHAKTYAL